ncbi:MAG: exodeoxyribonuclease VII small subunit [Clostridia bacterium]|nr:exodeoxyribonuclease VII small subunit [Clostridia bacterium]
MDENKKELSFEQALSRLEEIVRALDGGEAPLDQSLALFEEGVALVKLCSGKLDNAEQRVKILVRGDDGRAAEQDFVPPQNLT